MLIVDVSSASPFTVDTSTIYASGGNVGIRTVTPATNLDVNGSAQFGAGATRSTITATGLLKLTSNGIQWADGSTSTTATSGSSGGGNTFSTGLGLGPTGGATDSAAIWIWAKSVDGATQSSGCFVNITFPSASLAETATFTSSTTASSTPAGILLENSCSPGSTCKVGIMGIFRIVSDSVASIGATAQNSATRCRVNPLTGLGREYEHGRFLSSAAGSGSWAWFIIGTGGH